ncbi:hypothetical protein F0562_028230 [Nyssa sinensis]|uniref:Leucine-rich repeat-containing N-terminal plant-type domain-containing protein n=1 Tax=Nyssa sinensis TaxID=561372 RepID=A0A5J5B8C4_9ASTE|nr:hypothetical protein F0562_028230 [Nyssa sinensis]
MEKTCFILFVLVLLPACLASTVTNLTTDQSALLAFKAHINVDPYDVLANNWSTTASVCHWIGVSCGVRHQRVTALNLSDMGLTGIIAPHLGNLSFLASLNLFSNDFHGYVPKELAHLHRLKKMDLGSNSFTGEVPSWFGMLPKLQHLYLDSNNFTGVIPSETGNLRRLEVLSLPSNSLKGHIPSFIFNISSLRKIDLRNNSLSGSLLVGINNDLPNLEELDLSYNRLSGTLPNEIGDINLERLSIHESSLTGLIPFKIFNISTIRMIDLHSNQLSGHLPICMGCWLPNLEELYLGSNKLTGTIPSSISNASKLTIVEMVSNSFTGFIPNTLGNLRLLRRLLLAENNLTRDSSTQELRFFSSLTNCRQLEMFELSLNQLNGILPISVGNLSTSLQQFIAFGCGIKGKIPSGIGNLSSLQVISLDSNQLTGFIPTTLERLQQLDRLYLEHNRLEGYIPNNLCQIRKLGDLYLSDNQLYGPIPACLGDLNSLRHIYLESNKLTSTIPSTLWGLKDLLGLNLSSNFLSGHLPLEVGNLKVITEIDLSWNQFSGDIPSTIAGAQSLVSLSFAHNSLQGSIPESLHNLISLEFLDLSNNNLSGMIPKSLAALRYLQYFNVSFNRLHGEIPTGGCFANFTAQSFLQNDALCGEPRLQVPPCKTRTHSQSRPKIVPLLKYILPPIALVVLIVAFIFALIRARKQNMKLPTRIDSLPPAWRRVSYQELIQATDAFCESNLLEGEIMAQTMTLATIGYMAPEYGTEGIISTRGDIYSYGITLMETFVRKKPTDEMFAGEMSLKSWVNEALCSSIIEVVDKNLIGREDEHFSAKEQCVSSILVLAMDCSTDSPSKRINMEDTVARLKKIKTNFLANTG